MNSGPPGKVRRSPKITLGIPNCTTAAAAEITRHQSRIENCVTKTSYPTGVAQTINFRMGHRVGVLDAFVVTDC
jgi:hypothetical protein